MTDDQFRALCNTYGFAPSRALREMLDAAMKEEREACAQACEDHFSSDGHWCASAIRSRSST